jgi:Domain of unknown function (DUF4120)
MLSIQDQKHFDDVVAFAKQVGLYERHDDNGNSTLKSRLDYLEKYGGTDNDRTRVRLFRDFAPYSFAFLIERKDDRDEWRTLFNGGLLYHGPHDGHGSGGAPTLAVTLTPTTGWAIHT